MKRSLLALAVTVLVGGVFAATAAATTFPALTTIYVGSGVADTGSGENAGTATTFHCTNASGLLANIRFLVLSPAGLPLASAGFNSVPHGATRTISTHPTLAFADNSLGTGLVLQGGAIIEATESGVFCSANVIDAASGTPSGVPLRLVRINPHPGAAE